MQLPRVVWCLVSPSRRCLLLVLWAVAGTGLWRSLASAGCPSHREEVKKLPQKKTSNPMAKKHGAPSGLCGGRECGA